MIKTGTLAQVSALAGEIPTQERGKVWFVIMNAGSSNIEGFINQQDRVLHALDQHWQILPEATQGSIPDRSFLGDPSRISQSF